MALTTLQEANIVFKKVAADKATTAEDRTFFEEAINARKAILLDDIWTQSDQIPATAAPVSGVVEFVNNLTLTHIPGTNAFTDPTLKNVIPFTFGDGISYIYQIRTGTNVTVPFGFRDWYLDPEGGVLNFFAGLTFSGSIIVNETNPPSISCYKYIGTTGDFGNLGGGGTGPSVAEETLNIVTNGDTLFTLSNSVTRVRRLSVNGQSQVNGIDFTVSGTTLTWISTDFDLETSDELIINYEF